MFVSMMLMSGRLAAKRLPQEQNKVFSFEYVILSSAKFLELSRDVIFKLVGFLKEILVSFL